MADHTSRGPWGTPQQTTTGMAVPVVVGDVSAEELSAIIAVVAVLASGTGDNGNTGDGNPGETDRPRPAAGSSRRSPWGSPAGALRVTHPHGPGGWRASTFPS